MKKSELKQLIKEEVKSVMKLTESGVKWDPKEYKYTLTKGNETAIIQFSKLTYDWYANLEKDGKTVYEEFRGGYRAIDANGNPKTYDGSISPNKWKEKGFTLLADLYNKVKKDIEEFNIAFDQAHKNYMNNRLKQPYKG
jgi:hypothetical protein